MDGGPSIGPRERRVQHDGQPCESERVVSLSTARADATDNLALLHDAAETAECVRLEQAGTYPIAGTFEPAHSCKDLFIASGVTLLQVGEGHIIRRRGQVEPQVREVTRNIDRGDTAIELEDVSGLAVGDWLFVRSDDDIRVGGKSKAGMLRRIEGVEGKLVHLDRAMYRAMRTAPTAHRIELAPSLRIHGGGTLAFDDPNGQLWAYHIRWLLVEEPRVENMELKDGPASAIHYQGTVGGHTLDTVIHNLADDQDSTGWLDEHGTRHANRPEDRNVHYGYAHEAAAGARDLLIDGGEIWWVRHAFTTNHGTHNPKPLDHAGEPEEITFSVDIRDTTSSGVNTHEGGWNIYLEDFTVTRPGRYWAMGESTQGKEDPSALYIRNNRAFVSDVTLEDGPEYGVGSYDYLRDGLPEVRPTFERLTVKGFGNKALHLKTPAKMSDVVVQSSRIGFHLQGPVTGARIQVQGPAEMGFLIADGVSGVRLREVTIEGVSQPIVDNGSDNLIEMH